MSLIFRDNSGQQSVSTSFELFSQKQDEAVCKIIFIPCALWPVAQTCNQAN